MRRIYNIFLATVTTRHSCTCYPFKFKGRFRLLLVSRIEIHFLANVGIYVGIEIYVRVEVKVGVVVYVAVWVEIKVENRLRFRLVVWFELSNWLVLWVGGAEVCGCMFCALDVIDVGVSSRRFLILVIAGFLSMAWFPPSAFWCTS